MLMLFQTLRFVCFFAWITATYVHSTYKDLFNFQTLLHSVSPKTIPRFSTAHFTEWFCDKMGRRGTQGFWFFPPLLSPTGYVTLALSPFHICIETKIGSEMNSYNSVFIYTLEELPWIDSETACGPASWTVRDSCYLHRQKKQSWTLQGWA